MIALGEDAFVPQLDAATLLRISAQAPSDELREEFEEYAHDFAVIRNLPVQAAPRVQS